MRGILTITALALLLGGCEKKREVNNPLEITLIPDTSYSGYMEVGPLWAETRFNIPEGAYPDSIIYRVDIRTKPCLPCSDTVYLEGASTILVDRMPPGRWVKLDNWDVRWYDFPDSAYCHTGTIYLRDKQRFPWPDSVFIPDQPGEER